MSPRAKTQKPLIAVSQGDPAGIGPELCLRILRNRTVLSRCVPIVFGDANVLKRAAHACNLPAPEQVIPLRAWPPRTVPTTGTVVDCKACDAGSLVPGQISGACGHAAYAYIEAAVRATLSGDVSAIATAPIHKESLHLAQVPFPGHTEILAHLTGTKRFCMMLACEELAVSLATIHIALADVPRSLSPERVAAVIALTHEALRRLGKQNPRLTVLGLNPHAGEHGLFGREDEDIVRPAVDAARRSGLNVQGPLPSDTAFIDRQRNATDAYVAMYHDQGLIPFKMLAFDRGVNLTLGLPIVRTSVDHGVAFDIAWQGKASANSLTQSLLWAARLATGPRNPAR